MQCGANETNWDYQPITQNIIESTNFLEVSCFTSLPKSDYTPLEFRIEKTNSLIDISNIFMYVREQILGADGSVLPTTENVGPCNLLSLAQFSNIELIINDVKISLNQDMFPWVAYTLTLLHYSKSGKIEILEPSGWVKDTATFADTYKWIGVTTNLLNTGLRIRGITMQESRAKEYYFRVFTDTMLAVSKLIPNQTEIILRFHRFPTNKCLIGNPDSRYKLNILDAKLYVPCIKMIDPIFVDRYLSRANIEYHTLRYDTRTRALLSGTQNLDWIPYSYENLPRRIYIFQILQSAYNGKIENNIFNYQPFKMSKLEVAINDRIFPTTQGLSFGGENMFRAYANLQRELNFHTPDIDITATEFKTNYFIVPIDLTPDHSASCPYISPIDPGTLRIKLTYEIPLEKSIVVFCIGEFNSSFTIGMDRVPVLHQ